MVFLQSPLRSVLILVLWSLSITNSTQTNAPCATSLTLWRVIMQHKIKLSNIKPVSRVEHFTVAKSEYWTSEEERNRNPNKYYSRLIM